jgi:hypothetical protein
MTVPMRSTTDRLRRQNTQKSLQMQTGQTRRCSIGALRAVTRKALRNAALVAAETWQ